MIQQAVPQDRLFFFIFEVLYYLFHFCEKKFHLRWAFKIYLLPLPYSKLKFFESREHFWHDFVKAFADICNECDKFLCFLVLYNINSTTADFGKLVGDKTHNQQ